MLTNLAIRDIVLIEKADIPFAEGVCVLSGETGAGKSILLDALGLAVGNRAETRLVRAGKTQGSVTAEFAVAGYDALKHTLADLGLEPDGDTLIIRRTLQQDGKSRCFVNDQPVSVAALKTLGEMLVEIHGQHDQRGLLDPSSHRDLLDAFGGLHAERKAVEAHYRAWREKTRELEALTADMEQARREEDYCRHMLEELEALSPETGEEEKLAEKRRYMMQGEKRIAALESALSELQGSTPVASSLHTAIRLLSRSSAIEGEAAAQIAETLGRAVSEVDEAMTALTRLAEESRFNPAELERAEERLFSLRGAARKYGVPVDGLHGLMEETQGKLALLESQDASLANLEQTVAAARREYLARAESLSESRKKAAGKLEKSVMSELAGLKMAGTKVTVAQEPLAESDWQAEGIDRIQFLATMNPGSPVAPLHKIASGGELSRFMLALKVAMRHIRSTPTVIFDEIDSGTGGATADAIGKRLAQLGETAQVLVVTHLPQVAAKGGHHLHIHKKSESGETHTRISVLSDTSRQEELARMLAGEHITDEARAAAGRLIAG